MIGSTLEDFCEFATDHNIDLSKIKLIDHHGKDLCERLKTELNSWAEDHEVAKHVNKDLRYVVSQRKVIYDSNTNIHIDNSFAKPPFDIRVSSIDSGGLEEPQNWSIGIDFKDAKLPNDCFAYGDDLILSYDVKTNIVTEIMPPDDPHAKAIRLWLEKGGLFKTTVQQPNPIVKNADRLLIGDKRITDYYHIDHPEESLPKTKKHHHR